MSTRSKWLKVFSRNLLLSLVLFLCVFFLWLLLSFSVNHWFWAIIMCLVVFFMFFEFGVIYLCLTILKKFVKFSANISSHVFFMLWLPFQDSKCTSFGPLESVPQLTVQSWCSGSSFSDSFYSVSFWIVRITMSSSSLTLLFLFWCSCLLILISMSYLGFIFQLLWIPYKFWFNVIHCKFYTGGAYFYISKSIFKLCSGMQLDYLGTVWSFQVLSLRFVRHQWNCVYSVSG